MAIDVKDLRFSYPGSSGKAVLNIRHWSVNSGDCVFLQGPSGSGKSTLLNVLSGILPVEQGSVSILGQRLESMSSHQRDRFRANHVGCVFQQSNLIPYLDAIDNIRLAVHFAGKSSRLSKTRSKIQDLLATLNISSTEWHRPASQLSIGQQQRVAIARAFINRPELLIVDEPTSSLDQKNRDDFMALLMSIVEQQGTTLIFVSHDKELSGYFQRVEALSDLNAIEGSQSVKTANH